MANKYLIGILVLVLLTSSIYILLPNNVRIDVGKTYSTFKVWENDSWVLAGQEYTLMFDGTTKMRASSRTVESFVHGNIVTIVRTANFKDNVTVVDTYTFDGDEKDIKLFPISHEINVLNGEGYLLVYEVTKLEYFGETIKDILSPQEFGHNMRIEWEDGNYYSRIWGYANKDEGKLTVKYRPDSADFTKQVRLFDPPVEGEIGYEFLDDNKIVHIWNTQDDYFFDVDSGIQLTNHYEDYWTRNIFCIGYYNNDEWNKIACADKLTNFQKSIESNGETYVNATLWKDIEYNEYDLRLGVQYHLGLDDKTLSITIYGKNIGIDIPFDLGFVWKVTDWEIPHAGTTKGDSMRINNTDYELNGTYDLLFKNMTRTYTNWTEDEETGEPINNGLLIEPIPTLRGFDYGKYLTMDWNENLTYAVKMYGDGNQENFYIALLINAGRFDSGDSRTTTFQWIDAEWDISTAVYLQEISVAAKELSPTGVFFKPDGTKMYTIGYTGDSVDEYNLSTAWNVTSAVYLQEFYVGAKELSPTGVFFKPDGTKMYTSGQSGDTVDEYNLSTAWDVTTAVYLQEFFIRDIQAIIGNIFFKSDGTKMYDIGRNPVAVGEYNLSTAWNITTISLFQNFSVSDKELTPYGIFFKPDGTKMYVMGYNGDNVNEYDLSDAWNISSAVWSQLFYVGDKEATPWGLFFRQDGAKMYTIGPGGDSVDEYDLPVIPLDETPPTYSNNQANTTIAGANVNFSITYDDDTALEPDGTYIFSTNNTGAWVNESKVNFTSTPQSISTIKTLNTTIGETIGYRWYANDSAGNNNNTPIYSLTVTSTDTCSCPGAGENWEVDMEDCCNLTSACTLTTGNLSFIGSSGYFNCSENLNISNRDAPPDATTFYRSSGCRLIYLIILIFVSTKIFQKKKNGK